MVNNLRLLGLAHYLLLVDQPSTCEAIQVSAFAEPPLSAEPQILLHPTNSDLEPWKGGNPSSSSIG
jgi:hypothetical protein